MLHKYEMNKLQPCHSWVVVMKLCVEFYLKDFLQPKKKLLLIQSHMPDGFKKKKKKLLRGLSLNES